jgi:hypothetical protein
MLGRYVYYSSASWQWHSNGFPISTLIQASILLFPALTKATATPGSAGTFDHWRQPPNWVTLIPPIPPTFTSTPTSLAPPDHSVPIGLQVCCRPIFPQGSAWSLPSMRSCLTSLASETNTRPISHTPSKGCCSEEHSRLNQKFHCYHSWPWSNFLASQVIFYEKRERSILTE